ncbi:hypothetical protein [Kosakonia sacchari]|uniref:hypothetical protein n=1 Tax=Kosakonia sacchari TaxID=1158459 RepID=UPI0013621D29|nr:hypothetical protein [Kosakonia sacchari]QHM96547.1 hypothetical protein FGE25_20775 [Kosakonia sacchari]
MNYERVTYKEIKFSFLDSCYSYCRHKVKDIKKGGPGWAEGEHEIGYAYEQFENAYDLPIEKLMLEVVALIFWGGRCSEHSYILHKKAIDRILSEINLDVLVSILGDDERQDFLGDIELLLF